VGNTIGKVAIVPEDIGEACINPNTVLVKRAKVEARFLYYHLTSAYAQHYLRANSLASAQPAINHATIKELLVPVPPITEQRAIAQALGALDDKIELNRRVNETLEATARAIFKSWFVDFDPVRAKAASRQACPPTSPPCSRTLSPTQQSARSRCLASTLNRRCRQSCWRKHSSN
jgi:type I restriction enzyme S subunit